MKQLTCEMCGSTDLIKKDGVFVCQTCGCKYSVEEARKMMAVGAVEVTGTVKVNNTGLIDSYLQMAENALNSSNNAEAESYANKILEIDPRNYQACFIKGKSSGWQTTGRNNRYPESILNWINAYNYAPEDEKEKLGQKIQTETTNISTAILQMELNSFINVRSKSNKNDIDNALSMIKKQLELLKEKTSIDVYTDEFKTSLARTLNSGVVGASDAADKAFGPEKRNKDKYSWNKYTEAQDMCLSLLDTAYQLTSNDDICLTICKNYIYIAEHCRDSCSYTYVSSAYISDSYVPEYSFTQSAIDSRTKNILEWEKRQERHDPAKRKSNIEKAKSIVADSRSIAEKKMAINKYWQEHASEKEALQSRKSDLEQRLTELKAKVSANMDKLKMDRLDSTISSLNSQMNSLGFFKVKEKKALQAQLYELKTQRTEAETKWLQFKKLNDYEQTQTEQQIKEICDELSKDRGPLKVSPKRQITLFNNGEYAPTALQLVAYHKAVLPDNITVRGEGKNAVQNYTEYVVLLLETQLSILNNILGKKDETNPSHTYKDDPEKSKIYRINFDVNNDESNVSCNFSGKTVESVIEKEYFYILEKEKTPDKVANYIRIVSSSILGICPSIDIEALQTALAESAYGINSGIQLESDGIIITMTGSGKEDAKTILTPKEE